MKKAIIAFAGALLCAPAAQAQNCALNQIASLPVSTIAGGKIAVPVKISGVDQFFAVGLDTMLSGVTKDFADQQGFDTGTLAPHFDVTFRDPQFTHGETVTLRTKVTLPDLQIGSLDAKNMEVSEIPTQGSSVPVVGILGSGVLQHFDIEFDPANGKMNLYAPNQCTGGAVVYWANEYAVADMKIQPGTGRPIVAMTLDGHPVRVGISTTSRPSTMMRMSAAAFIGVDETSSDFVKQLVPVGNDDVRYPFKTLSVGGIALANPAIHIIPDENLGCIPPIAVGGNSVIVNQDMLQCHIDMYLGINEIRRLHLYFAFAEKKLYVTAADAHK